MFTLRHSVAIAPDKINVFIKSCTISLKLNDGLHYSPLFIQLKKLIYKIQFPLSRPSMIYVDFFQVYELIVLIGVYLICYAFKFLLGYGR